MTESGPELDQKFEELLDYLRQSRGFDFTGYKRASLMRRVRQRMQTVAIRTFEDYLDYLEVHPEEFGLLFNTILINVTGFFRDGAAWNFVRDKIVPRILAGKEENGPIRIWSAGCASGEEAYTIAIVFAEALGDDAFKNRVKIYASDVDEDALATARTATYSVSATESVSAGQKERFFERSNSRFTFRTDLRRAVIFGRHDLLHDAPISRLDFLVCRNTLMYFNAETQRGVLGGFHFALNPGGVLFLGKAEMLLSYHELFAPVDWKCRLFVKSPNATTRERWIPALRVGGFEALSQPARNPKLQDLAFEASPVARLVLDADGRVSMVTCKLGELFGVGSQDVGRPLQDLEISYRPMELRSLIEEALAQKKMITRTNVERRVNEDETEYYDVSVTPLFDGQAVLGTIITFVDVTEHWHMQKEIEESNKKLEIAYEELQAAHEELETTNEELQSTNEELQTTNEELQSSNEELETMNEELHSSNEELRAVNDALGQRTDELAAANQMMDRVLVELKTAVALLEPDGKIVMWNRTAEETWGVRADEVRGIDFFTLDIGMNVSSLRDPVNACLAEGTPFSTEIAAINRRGRPIRCRVAIEAQDGISGRRRRAIVLVEVIDDAGRVS